MSHSLTTQAISAIFAEGVQSRGGRVTDTFDDGSRLFARSLLPFVEEVRAHDHMQGGLALRATETDIWLHPYLFRQVCRNGAIVAQALESWHVEYSEDAPADEVIEALQDAIGVCSEPDVFTTAVADVRTSLHADVNLALNMASLLSQQHSGIAPALLRQIFRRFSSDRDQSRYALMNAVTSVARDTHDPEQRWRLEELGGGIGAGLLPTQPPTDHDHAAAPLEDTIEVA